MASFCPNTKSDGAWMLESRGAGIGLVDGIQRGLQGGRCAVAGEIGQDVADDFGGVWCVKQL